MTVEWKYSLFIVHNSLSLAVCEQYFPERFENGIKWKMSYYLTSENPISNCFHETFGALINQ